MNLIITILLALLLLTPTLWAQDNYLYIGSYTSNKDGSRTGSEGIYIYKFDSETGKLDSVGSTDGTVESPSFLTVSHNGKYLYAGTDTRTPGQGSVSSFVVDSVSGLLSFLNKIPSGGDNPLYVDVSTNGKSLACANYGTSSFAVFPLDSNGAIGPHYFYNFFNQSEQATKSHAHCAVFTPLTHHIVVADLGLDRLELHKVVPLSSELVYVVDTANGDMILGNGPRHIVFHPLHGKTAYLVEEKSGTVAVFNFTNRKLYLRQRIPTHTPDAQGPFESADIHLSPDGKFLYASNRGQENNIAIFKVDPKSGKLTPVGYQSTLGITPRNFAIDPSGNYLLAANQSTGNVVVFKRDKKTGLLTPTGETINIPQVSCLKFLKL